MEFEHDRFGKCVLNEITQKQLADYSKDMQGKSDETMIVWRGESVKAAIKHGFLIEPEMKVGDVDGSTPGLIRWLSDVCIAGMVQEVTNIDPLS